MKNKIGFVGLGAAGSNIVDEFYKREYDSLCINTASADLDSVQCKLQHHIAGASGCNKNRKKALQIAMEKYKEIGDVIINTFPKKKIINVAFSMAGGTGSGFAPLVLDYLKQRHPETTYNAITILPNKNESFKSQINTVECYEQLKQVEGVNGFYVLDNNNCNGDRFIINEKFADFYDNLVHITTPDKRGVIDGAELDILLTTKGNVYIALISDIIDSLESINDSNFIQSTNLDWRIQSQIKNNPFTQFDYGCKYLALSLAHEKVNYSCLERVIGMPIDTFVGYNKSNKHIMIVAGMPFPKRRIAQIIENVNIQQNKLLQNQNIKIPQLKLNSALQESFGEIKHDNENKKIDIQGIFNKYK